MTFPANTIKLGAAQAIFAEAKIEEIRIGDRIVGYEANFDGKTLQQTSLTTLCRSLWSAANSLPVDK